MKIKDEYKGKRVHHNGINYDFSNMNEEKLKRVYDTNPSLRYLFEEECPFELPILTDEEQFFKNKPEDKTEEEFFEETIKEVVKKGRKKKSE